MAVCLSFSSPSLSSAIAAVELLTGRVGLVSCQCVAFAAWPRYT